MSVSSAARPPACVFAGAAAEALHSPVLCKGFVFLDAADTIKPFGAANGRAKTFAKP